MGDDNYVASHCERWMLRLGIEVSYVALNTCVIYRWAVAMVSTWLGQSSITQPLPWSSCQPTVICWKWHLKIRIYPRFSRWHDGVWNWSLMWIIPLNMPWAVKPSKNNSDREPKKAPILDLHLLISVLKHFHRWILKWVNAISSHH